MVPMHVPPARPYRLRSVDRPPASLHAGVLACVLHEDAAPIADDDPRRIQVRLAALAGPAVELWEADAPVSCGWAGRIGYAHSAHLLFAQCRVPAAAMADPRAASAAVYADLSAFFAQRPRWHWIRTWNYIGGIHAGVGDAERYRQFCLGRHEILSLQPDFERNLPAATAIGTPGDDMLVYVLATSVPGAQIENPRQVSAFRYPRQYAPRSPSFSRAMRVDWRDGTDLIVSGTASVVGHETAHVGDPRAQLRETLANLQQLAAAERLPPEALWAHAQAKLFVRDAAVYEQVRDLLRDTRELRGAQITVLAGEVCRPELLLEIELLLQTGAR